MTREQCQNRIASLRRRWPALGEALDPQIVGFFLQREEGLRRGSLRYRTLLLTGRYVAPFLLALSIVALITMHGTAYGWIVFYPAIVLGSHIQSKLSKYATQPSGLLRKSTKTQLVELWLTPLTPRDLLAAEAGCLWVSSSAIGRCIQGLLRWITGMIVTAFLVFRAGFFTVPLSIERGAWLASLAILLTAVAMLLGNRDLQVRSSLNTAVLALRAMQSRARKIRLIVIMFTVMMIVYALIFLVIFGGRRLGFIPDVAEFIALMYDQYGVSYVSALLMLVLATLVLRRAMRWDPARNDALFARKCMKAEKLYARAIEDLIRGGDTGSKPLTASGAHSQRH